MKKGTSVLIIALFVVGLFNVVGIPNAAAKDVKEMKLFHDNPEWQQIWVEFGEASAEDIGIKAIPTEFETQVYKSRVKVDLTTRRAPAVFKWWFGYRAMELLEADLIADLSDVWDEVGGNFAPGVREALTIDDVTYAFPLLVGYWVWYYSKPVYEKYDLELPKTWDEFTKQLAFFKENGVSGIGNTIGKSRWTSFIVFQEILYRVDFDFYNRLMNGQAHYTDPPVVQAMEIWKDMLEKGYFAPMDATYVEDLPRMIKDGSLAFAPFGDWYGGILQQQGLVPEKDYGVFIPPAITPKGEGAVILEISPLVAGKKSPELDLAKEWFKWYAGSKSSADLLWGKLRFAVTTNISAEAIAKDDPVLASELDLLKAYPTKLIRFWEATPVEIVEHAVDAFNTMLVHPDQYMDLLNGIEEKAKETWPKYGVEY
jgi:ABC-type glycerol-3-phosphate transport system substrate-binding protein